MKWWQKVQTSARYQSWLAHYQKLSTRDQRSLVGLCLFLLASLFYLLLWSPLSQWSHQQQSLYLQQRSANLWLKQNVSIVEQPVANESINDAMLAPIVTQAAREAGINLNRVQPGNGTVSVWIEETPWQALIPWLVNLENQHPLHIQKIRIDRLPLDGVIKAHVQIGS
ncbi:type II secretion system protein GspM [Endozoicomonas acroporae]|uniref:type II secretion system protein GspM n=1 Tax=Endozoicomonas acroporae TaxID=1701104 RepID=UPI003D7B9FEB